MTTAAAETARTFEVSARVHEDVSRFTPSGAQTASKAPGRVGPLGAFPLYLQRGDGPYVWDVDDYRYVDLFNGNCAVTLGHANRHVDDRVQRQMAKGTLLSLPTRLEGEVAERLCAVIPCAEQVRFVKTGSEACAGAVRIARIATGRKTILVCDGQYHGWHDWHCVTKPDHPGVPDELADLIWTFRYNDLDSLRDALNDDGDVAAVMLEPTLTVPPAPGFLEGLVALAHEHGALVIFDEMICGNRWHVGGAQAHYGVTPDLATCGKAYANGYPLAFIGGRRELMQHAWPVSGTFGGETMSLAACQAVLEMSTDPIDRIWQVGRQLMDATNGACRRLGLPAEMVGMPPRPVLQWSAPAAQQPAVVALFQQELAQRGVLAHPSGFNPSAAHDAQALELAITGIEGALTVVARAIATGSPASFLRGELLRPAFTRST